MPTDLKTCSDHPAALLALAGADFENESPRPDETVTGRTVRLVKAAGITDAADILKAYEQRQQVTFVALDNDALRQVTEAYKALAERPLRVGSGEQVTELLDALDSLLGIGPE